MTGNSAGAVMNLLVAWKKVLLFGAFGAVVLARTRTDATRGTSRTLWAGRTVRTSRTVRTCGACRTRCARCTRCSARASG